MRGATGVSPELCDCSARFPATFHPLKDNEGAVAEAGTERMLSKIRFEAIETITSVKGANSASLEPPGRVKRICSPYISVRSVMASDIAYEVGQTSGKCYEEEEDLISKQNERQGTDPALSIHLRGASQHQQENDRIEDHHRCIKQPCESIVRDPGTAIDGIRSIWSTFSSAQWDRCATRTRARARRRGRTRSGLRLDQQVVT